MLLQGLVVAKNTILLYTVYHINFFGGLFLDVQVGDTIIARKNHPCGGHRFAVLRVGMDFRIRCEKCGREIMLARNKIEKNIKKIEREGANIPVKR